MVPRIGQTSQWDTERAFDCSHERGLRTGRPRIQAHLHANMHGRKEKELHSLTKERLGLLR